MTSYSHHSRSTTSLHGDGHGDRHHRSSGRESKGSKSGSKRGNTSHASQTQLGPVSFLFAVNEFTFRYAENSPTPRDQWNNILPPATAAEYGSSDNVPVYRYTDGSITLAEGYHWWRSGPGQPGGIYRYDAWNNLMGQAMDYTVHSIVSCSESPCLPFLVTEGDASISNSCTHLTSCHCQELPGENELIRWRLLHFDHIDGVSRANALYFGHPYVAGRKPSWMPALVPKAFENPRGPQIQSRGLSGDVSIVIGLMAFHSDPGNPQQVFENGWWWQNTWAGPRTRPAYHTTPGANQTRGGDPIPRGFLVHVCVDVDSATTPPENLSMERVRHSDAISQYAAENAWIWDTVSSNH
ncbi:hypothetical protein B0T20DRAFT_5108 [Sordaria brevicollis]|uniref:Uncharacterized protein n=1 Tax=Sordaria brevicollis TaxID=83679 RepID=A0AAE0PMH2_SORBR|nr:hypothetical protein B0T20DRAFT_5108 [Sordaria brevicollis]